MDNINKRTMKEGGSSESTEPKITSPKLQKSNGKTESNEKPNPEEEKSPPAANKEREWDFKLVFIHPEPDQITKQTQKMVQQTLESNCFVRNDENGTSVRILSIVAQPKIFKQKDETNPGVEELEPRIEYYLAMYDKTKHIGCFFVLEHLTKQLWEKQQEPEFSHLRYRVEIPAVANGAIEMPPFKRHFSAMDSAHLSKISFGNILWHNQLYVHRYFVPEKKKLQQIFDDHRQRIQIKTGKRGRSVDPVSAQNPNSPNRRTSSSVAINRDRGANLSGSSKFGGTPANLPSTSNSANNSPGQNIGGFGNKNRSISGASNFNNQQPVPLEKDSGVVLNDEEEDFVTRSVTPPAEEEKIDENTKKNITKSEKKKTKNSKMDSGRKTDLGMKLEFEHDRQMLNILFYVPYQPKNNWTVIDKVKLEVRYSSITQVLLALKRKGKEKFVTRLMLRLVYPPTIWHTKDVFGIGIGGMKNPEKDRRGYRVVDWLPGPGHDIKDSPVLVMDLQPNEAKRISPMLGRLMVELRIGLELRNVMGRKVERPINLQLPDQYYDDNELRYWMEALATRGYVVLDHWIVPEERDHFFNFILEKYNENREKTMDTLEELANKLWDRAEIKHYFGLEGMLRDIWGQMWRNGSADRNWLKDGYERVRKVLITPSRIVLCGHEVLMGNRVLRFDPDYPPTKFLRVIFRDENLDRLRKNEVERLLDVFILKPLIDGIEAGGLQYSFIGTSNSQMRDGGCYFLQGDLDEVNAFRNRLGQFARVPTIPKMMARLGLCFTQGRETGVDMSKRMLGWDFEGGENAHGNSYTFSDGCGCMSLYIARKITDELGMDPRNPPSCFQFRYAGYKGVLAINPVLDSNMSWWDELNDVQRDQFGLGSREDALAVDFLFRPSQKKFDVWEEYEDKCKLEIVKHSAPTIVVLNKPLINILDQVSRMQSHECHKRICARIHALMDKHIFTVCASLTDETVARRRLQELPGLIDYAQLQSVKFTREPFFRLVLRAAARVSIHKLRQKLAIAIPPSLGRMMFGVIDETGILQSGQVFAQYTEDITGGPDEHHRRRSKKGVDKKRILTGSVLITKNPSIVGGDVRMFEAVDVEALYHLVDVLVFPRFGPRPHSDEMAGSDLDGDEYTLIWDPELALEGNQPAADYSTPKDPTNSADPSSVTENDEIVANADKFQSEMAKFFVNYLRNDSVGQIANSHLANSDLYGIESDLCVQIAIKHSQAVDFPKTGKAPKQLIANWNEAADMPPEKYERAPDFMDKGANEPEYVSTRLNSQLYNRIKSFSDFLTRSISDESFQLPDMDNLLLSSEGHEDYLSKAAQHYEQYDYAVRGLMDTYGIQCEGELFSSSYSSIRNRFSDRENDDMSFYTTSRLIEHRLWGIREATRKAFFTAYGDKMENLVDDDGICKKGAPEKLQRLAQAYYTITYNSISRKLLSFPWMACWDVLDAVRSGNVVCSSNSQQLFRAMFDHFGDNLRHYIERFLSTHTEQLAAFYKRRFRRNGTEVEQLLRRYIMRHKGLALLMFFCISWADHMGLFRQSALDEEHVCLLLLSYGLLNMPHSAVSTEERGPWLKETPSGWTTSDCDVTQQMGRRFCSFVEALASRHFDQMCSLDFVHLGLGPEYCFMFKGEWRPLHRIALDTYQHLVFMDHHERVLPPLSTSITHSLDADASGSRVMRGDVFVIELPPRQQTVWLINNRRLLLHLCEKTGCVFVILRLTRAIPHRIWNPFQPERTLRPARVRVSSWGTRQALDALRRLFAVSPQLDLTQNRRGRIQILPEQTLEKLDSLVNGAMRERTEGQGEQGMESKKFMERVEEEAEEEPMELEGEIGEDEEEVASDD